MNDQKAIHSVKSSELPASCPPKDGSSETDHPRVYLKFNDGKNASCPYCGAKYVLEN